MKICFCKIEKFLSNEKQLKIENHVSPERLHYSRKYLKIEDRLRCLFSFGLLKFMKYKFYSIDIDGLEIVNNKFGKPETNQFHFNITHAGNYIGCAIDERSVGIDVEIEKTIEKGIARRFFHKDELNYLESSLNFKKDFFKIWTLKESYIKAIGQGLSCPLDSFSVISGNKIVLSLFDEKLEMMKIKSLEIEDGYSAAICYHPSISNISKPVTINQETLLNELANT